MLPSYPNEIDFTDLIRWVQSWLSPVTQALPPFYIAGGSVRDSLLGRAVRDIDIVSASADRLAGLVAKANNARAVRFEKREGEVNFRIVGRTDPGQAIDISRMQGKDIVADLCARDFTINALAVCFTGADPVEIIDPLNGQADLFDGIIRMASPASLGHDPIRILRAFRLAAELGFAVEPDTCRCIHQIKDRLAESAPERIREELIRIFASIRSTRYIRRMAETGVLSVILPEIERMKGCTQNAYHHADVWQHSLAVMENCETITNHPGHFFGETGEAVRSLLESGMRLPLLKIAALFHDIGKPETRDTRPEDGRITFYGHDRKGAERIGEIARQLRFSARQCRYLEFLVGEHLHILALSDPAVNKSTIMRLIRKAGQDFIPLLILGMSDIKATLGTDSSEAERYRHLAWSADMAERFFNDFRFQLEKNPLITGKDVLALGVEPGPAVGEILTAVQNAHDDGRVFDRASALAYARELVRQGSLNGATSDKNP